MARRAPTLDLGGVVADALESAGRSAPVGGADPVTVAVLDAVTGLLADYGMRRWSIDDVAERAGLARATVYRRFESRDAMIHAALSRDAGRFFEAVAGAVRHLERIDDQVVAGFVVGLRLARRSPLTPLLRDASAAGDGPPMPAVIAIAGTALADRYRTQTGARDDQARVRDDQVRARADQAGRGRTEAVAEALVRLGLSYLLIPAPGVDLDDEEAARSYFGAVIRPLIGS